MNTLRTDDLSPKEAARDLGCHVSFVRSEIKRRRMRPVIRVNARVIRIPRTTLVEYKRLRTT